MEVTLRLALPVEEDTRVAEARRQVVREARRIGFDEGDCGRVALVVTELATNLLKHAGHGEIVAGEIERDGVCGIEVVAVDRGPGVPDRGRVFSDGYSTAGSPGTGLGAVRRLSSAVDMHSTVGKGTVVLARIWPRRAGRVEPSRAPLVTDGVCIPAVGEIVSGDAWAFRTTASGGVVCVADGLGHGPDAARAAGEAMRVFHAIEPDGLERIMERIHEALRPYRGAAVGLAEVDCAERVVRFCGVGNISGSIVSPEGTRSVVSHNGTVGHEVRRIQTFTYPWSPASLLVLHSDGLSTRWTLDGYPGVTMHDPGIIAGALYRDYSRRRDDVSVVVVREGAAA